MKPLAKIQRKDINGIQLQEGDIIATGKVGGSVWGGEAILLSRPIGIIYLPKLHPLYNKDYSLVTENDCYNVKEIRPGEVVITKDADEWMKQNLCGGTGRCLIHLATYDGDFYEWDSIEKIGSIYDFK